MIDYTYAQLQNPWWDNPGEIENDEKIKEYLSLTYKYWPKNVLDLPIRNSDINIITGPRQTGKSTAIKLYIRNLLKSKFPSRAILFFNCDALSKKQEIIDLIIEFDRRTVKTIKVIFLDEVSSIPNWSYAIKWLSDSGILKTTTVFLTGSSSILLKRSGEFLAGRRNKGKNIQFLPISFKDFLKLKGVDVNNKGLKTLIQTERLFEEFLIYGGFLRNINKKPPENDLYIQTLRSDLYKARKKEDFLKEVVKKILASLTSQTSYTNVAEEAELGSKNTAIEYLTFLTDSFFLKETKFYDINQNRVLHKKNKKFYTTDPYLIWLFNSFISGVLSFSVMEKFYNAPSEKAKLVENFIASELNKSHVDFYYYQNSSELDFYLPKEKLAIEVKYKNRITSVDLQPLNNKSIPKKVKKIIVTKNQAPNKTGGISLIPVELVTLSSYWPS
ncbi:hypothetical protein A2954_02610 [Candidatus Roizmanbacteria bacterium RIFCSPLOWO2_01_FULL_37_12]|uniref:AAA+ ATPase domain-containing protein n=1 Tax=Candidatus Roizmanbacteria bacterium RIFCSPLOWO2_01_FULL_37_12 TaxID=1802056 RepID=A0A1F7IEY1_9BACT|nr:MAG: hypothetical protein A2954_02610 [Candidatus Roizmanbacteria bacterium RIFCSPLOWO2_01_FULL_37_12]